MSNSIVARRYAVALYELGKEKASLESIENELNVLAEVYENEPAFSTYMNTPRVATEDKKNFIRNTFKDLTKDLVNTLLLLVDKGRVEIIPDMVRSFVEMKNEASGVAEADVYSVRELSSEELAQVEKVFVKRLNLNTLRMNNIVDASLLGGIRVQIGNKIYDGTLATQLKRLEQNLTSANK